MLYRKAIVDADFCIKLSRIEAFPYLEKLLPQLAEEVYIHETVNNEIRLNRLQIDNLIAKGYVKILFEKDLSPQEYILYQATFNSLAKIMMDKSNLNKNRGEVSSLAMAKVKSIPYFATDERNLQPIIDAKLNTGIDDIQCIRLVDIIQLIKQGNLSEFSRKDARRIWILSEKSKDDFDERIWPN